MIEKSWSEILRGASVFRHSATNERTCTAGEDFDSVRSCAHILFWFTVYVFKRAEVFRSGLLATNH